MQSSGTVPLYLNMVTTAFNQLTATVQQHISEVTTPVCQGVKAAYVDLTKDMSKETKEAATAGVAITAFAVCCYFKGIFATTLTTVAPMFLGNTFQKSLSHHNLTTSAAIYALSLIVFVPALRPDWEALKNLTSIFSFGYLGMSIKNEAPDQVVEPREVVDGAKVERTNARVVESTAREDESTSAITNTTTTTDVSSSRSARRRKNKNPTSFTYASSSNNYAGLAKTNTFAPLTNQSEG